MKHILIIDNTIDPEFWGSSDLVRVIQDQPELKSTVFVRRAPERDLPSDLRKFDGVIVSGSKTGATDQGVWIDELLEMIRQIVALQIPYLGVCYGHQMLNRALYGLNHVRTAQKPEFGWSAIELFEPHPLFQGLPQRFHSYSSHYDEVCQVGEGMKVLARSELCPIQACQFKDLPIFGVQFHPEKPLASCEKDLKKRLKTHTPPELLHPTESQTLYHPHVGPFLFKNFLSLIDSRRSP